MFLVQSPGTRQSSAGAYPPKQGELNRSKIKKFSTVLFVYISFHSQGTQRAICPVLEVEELLMGLKHSRDTTPYLVIINIQGRLLRTITFLFVLFFTEPLLDNFSKEAAFSYG